MRLSMFSGINGNDQPAHGRIPRVGAGGLDPTPGKSQLAICFIRTTGTDPPREAIGL